MHRHPFIATVIAALVFAALPALPAAIAPHSHYSVSAASPLDGKIGGGTVPPVA